MATHHALNLSRPMVFNSCILLVFVCTLLATHVSHVATERAKRQTAHDRVFVVRASDTGELFSVASIPPVDGEIYSFMQNVAELTMTDIGMVSHAAGADLTEVQFDVNVTNTLDSTSSSIVSVLMGVVIRGDFDDIFSTQPSPLRATIGAWVRPDSVLLELRALDAAPPYSCPVTYVLQSVSPKEGDGCFSVNQWTGDLTISCRQEFTRGVTYTLGVSAPCVGTANKSATPAQRVQVTVGELPPQFYANPYDVSFMESAVSGDVVTTITTKSFQVPELTYPVAYTLTQEDAYAAGKFTVDGPSGNLILQDHLSWADQPYPLYTVTVSATENFTQFESSTTTYVRLAAVNTVPVILADVYTRTDLMDAAVDSTDVLMVTGIDYNPGDLGSVDFTCDDEHFRVVGYNQDTHEATLQINGSLDYDLRPCDNNICPYPPELYDFHVTATDRGVPSLEGAARVQVWVENTNDNRPVFVPRDQHVAVKEQAGQGALVHVVQVTDPDGDNVVEITMSLNQNALIYQYFELDPDNGWLTLKQQIPEGQQNFVINVQAKDDNTCCGGTPSPSVDAGFGTIHVNVININHPPSFINCDMTAPTVTENNNVGDVVYTVSAITDNFGAKMIPILSVYDPDHITDGEVTISITSYGDVANNFEIDQTTSSHNATANIVAKRSFDREAARNFNFIRQQGKWMYPLVVQATDHSTRGPLTDTCFLMIELLDQNDLVPVFDRGVKETTIMRTLSLSSRVIRVFAWDDDEGINAHVTYSITNDDLTHPGHFIINPDSGWISTNAALESHMYTLEITATDDGVHAPPRPTDVPVIVTITTTDTSENLPPVWQTDLDAMNYTMYENTTIDSFLDVILIATQSVDTVDYKIVDDVPSMDPQAINSKNNFGIKSNGSMELDYVRAQLDFETCPVYVITNFATAGIFRSDARLRISLLDVNDNNPAFLGDNQLGQTQAYIMETEPPGTSVTKVTAVDEDESVIFSTVKYHFRDTCDDCIMFSLDIDTGEIFTTAALTSGDSYRIELEAVDNDDDQKRESTTVLVDVLGASMEPPVFPDDSHTVTVPEHATWNYTLGYYNTTVPDPVNSIPQYAIKSGNTLRHFGVDIDTGRLYVTARQLNSALNPTYTLTYRVFDGLKEDTVIINVEVAPSTTSGDKPVFTQDVYNSLTVIQEEDHALTYPIDIVTVSAPGSPSPTYSVEGALSEAFSIDASGNVKLTRAIDRDYPKGYQNWQFNVVADNGAAYKGYAVVNLRPTDLNDNVPVFDTIVRSGSIAENSGAATTVMTLVAHDVDTGTNANIVYSQVGTSAFVVSATGVVTFTGSETLDRETLDHYFITVVAKNSGPPEISSNEQTIRINVTDRNEHAPTFLPGPYSVVVQEDMPVGSSVLTLYVNDNDQLEETRLDFTVTGPDALYFYIDSIYPTQTGVVKVKEVLDYEAQQSYEAFADVTDGLFTAQVSFTVTVTDVNDNAPLFGVNSANQNITEGPGGMTWNYPFTATDPDTGDNGVFSYSIDYANSDPDAHFTVSSSGVVTLAQELDRETQETYTVLVLAEDQGVPSQTGTATLHVIVADINDNAPVFAEAYSAVVPADTAVGTAILTFGVTDADLPHNGEPFTVTYVCPAGDPCQAFTFVWNPAGAPLNTRSLNGNGEGVLTTAQSSYREPDLGFKYYNLNFEMADQHGVSENHTLDVRVESGNYVMHTAGNMDVYVYNYAGQDYSTSIGRIYCTDSDDWDLPEKTYAWEGSHDATFLMNASGGALTMQYGLPRGAYSLSALVTDTTWQQSAVCTATVHQAYIYGHMLHTAGSIRLQGVTRTEFLYRPLTNTGELGQSLYMRLEQSIADLLQVTTDQVDIFAVTQVTVTQLDVTFMVMQGDAYFKPSKLNGVIWNNKEALESMLGIQILMSPVSPCMSTLCWSGGCHNKQSLGVAPVTSGINQTIYVMPDVTYIAVCECGDTAYDATAPSCEPDTCLNGGTCHEYYNGFKCVCPAGYDGGRCQQTKATFTASSWLWVDRLTPCEDLIISLDVATLQADGLLLYNGPWGTRTGENPDKLRLELVGGVPSLDLTLAAGVTQTLNLPSSAVPINDGHWHSIEILKINTVVSLVVDRCRDATVNETLNWSTSNRTACQVTADLGGTDFRLDIMGPLQVGGRSDVTNTASLDGCVANLYVNGRLYDLAMDVRVQSGAGAAAGCATEGCGCPANSTCMGDLMGTTPICTCRTGWMGAACDTETPVLDLVTQDSFIQWNLSSDYSVIYPGAPYSHQLQAMFRTWRTDGVVFIMSSFTTLDRVILEVVDAHPQVRYDLGDGDKTISLQYVNVSDGYWHVATVTRYGNEVILKLDHGDGKYYVQSLPSDSCRLLIAWTEGTFGGADTRINSYSNMSITTYTLDNSCIQDVRLMYTQWMPMTSSQNGQSAMGDVMRTDTVDDVCEGGDACALITCPLGLSCVNLWRSFQCMCPPGLETFNVTACMAGCAACVNGDCVLIGGAPACYCWPGYEGVNCDVLIVMKSVNVLAIVLPIVILLLLLLLLLLFCCLWKRRGQKYVDDQEGFQPEGKLEIYNDDGAGEEDNHGFDLSNLQKKDKMDLAVNSNGGVVNMGYYGNDAVVNSNGVANTGFFGSDAAVMSHTETMTTFGQREGELKQTSAAGATMGAAGVAGAMGVSGGAAGMASQTAESQMTASMTTTSQHVRSHELSMVPQYSPDALPPRRHEYMSSRTSTSVSVFIRDQLVIIDGDPLAPPYDSVRFYEFEGEGSSAGSLSSLGTSSAGDQDFTYLADLGPHFQTLAELYGHGDESDDGAG